MNVLLALVLTATLCGLLVVGLAGVLRDLLRRDVRFSETPPWHPRKDNRYGIAAVAPTRNAASAVGAHAQAIGDRDQPGDAGGRRARFRSPGRSRPPARAAG